MSGMKDLLGDAPYPAGPGHAPGSETSRAAADSIRPHLAPIKRKIVDFLEGRERRGATFDEIARGCQLGVPTVCGRMVELVEAGLVKKGTLTRPTASSRQATVYFASRFAG